MEIVARRWLSLALATPTSVLIFMFHPSSLLLFVWWVWVYAKGLYVLSNNLHLYRRKKASIVRSRGRALGIEATPSILCISHMYLILHYDSLQKNKEYNPFSLYVLYTKSILNYSLLYRSYGKGFTYILHALY